jgi:hypothetical protein
VIDSDRTIAEVARELVSHKMLCFTRLGG